MTLTFESLEEVMDFVKKIAGKPAPVQTAPAQQLVPTAPVQTAPVQQPVPTAPTAPVQQPVPPQQPAAPAPAQPVYAAPAPQRRCQQQRRSTPWMT